MNKDVLHKGIAFLSRREHSYKELAQKLASKDFAQSDIDEVMSFLVEENYQCDQRFAESVCRHRADRGYGWLYIKNELKSKGVDPTIISSEIKEDFDWYLQAELAYNKRFGETPIKDQKDKAKRVRFLQNRGFSFDQIKAAMSSQ